MRIILIGCGKVGQALCRELAAENHEISVIDIVESKVNALVNEFDVLGVVGSGVDASVIQEAEVDKADLLLAMTHSDEINLLCCLLAKHFGNCTSIARVRSPEYMAMIPYLKEELNLVKIINPERIGASEIARVLRFPSVISVDVFSNGLAEILTFRVVEHSLLDGLQIREIPSRLKADLLVCAVVRKGQTFIPGGDFVLKAGDTVSVIGSGPAKARFFRKIGLNPRPIRKLMIVGGGLLTYYLIQELEHDQVDITVIDENEKSCNLLSSTFENITTVYGEGCDESLLYEEGINRMDAFAALSGIDEENIVLSLYAKGQGIAKTIAKVDKIRFDEVISTLSLDTLINLKDISAEAVLRYVRSLDLDAHSSIKTVNRLVGQEAEAIEWAITKESEITAKPLSQLDLQDGVLIAGIVRKGKNILPRGNDRIQAGDSVIVVTTHKGLKHITDILKGGKHA